MAGDEDQLYGSVSIADIADRLVEKGFDVSRQQVKLDPPIKTLGEFDVPVRLHPEVTVQIRIRVEREPA
jgi:large subunit ribosomal protein L9